MQRHSLLAAVAAAALGAAVLPAHAQSTMGSDRSTVRAEARERAHMHANVNGENETLPAAGERLPGTMPASRAQVADEARRAARDWHYKEDAIEQQGGY